MLARRRLAPRLRDGAAVGRPSGSAPVVAALAIAIVWRAKGDAVVRGLDGPSELGATGVHALEVLPGNRLGLRSVMQAH